MALHRPSFPRQDGGMADPFRVPADDAYVALLGRAVYNFAYLEWAVIYTIETLTPGYLNKYTGTAKPITSGAVADTFGKEVLGRTNLSPDLKAKLVACADRFTRLVTDRNRLIHGHPYTAEDENQQLSYQGRLPSTSWSISEVEAIAHEFDDAACEMNDVFHQLRGS